MNDSPSKNVADDLRLLIRSAEDLEVLSTLLQDAIIPGEDMLFDRDSNRFILVANRFCWDVPPIDGLQTESGGPVYQRRLCGVQFRGVTRVQQAGMPTDRKAAFFNLLAITPVAAGDPDNAGQPVRLHLAFSGGASLQIGLESLDILAEDLSTPQPTGNQPTHDLAESPAKRSD